MNAYTGNEPYVFISYAHDDWEKVEPVIIGLKRQMCRIWYDEGLTPGESWNDDLAAHLKNADCVVVLLAKHSVQSKYVKAEINFAISHEKKIVPISLDSSELPFGLELMLGHLQIAKLYDESDSDKQVSTIASLLPKSVFATKKIPFYENGDYSFFLEKFSIPNSNPQYDTHSENFSIACKNSDGVQSTLFEFHSIPAYEMDYTVTQCRSVNDDYFVGEIHGIVIFNVLARCCLNYPLSGPDFDILMIFALRTSDDDKPSVKLIDYQNIHITHSKSSAGKKIINSPWGNALEKECRKLLYQ